MVGLSNKQSIDKKTQDLRTRALRGCLLTVNLVPEKQIQNNAIGRAIDHWTTSRQANLDDLYSNRRLFHSSLLGELKHFVSDIRLRNLTLTRGGRLPHLSVEQEMVEERFQVKPVDDVPPKSCSIDTAIEALWETKSDPLSWERKETYPANFLTRTISFNGQKHHFASLSIA